VLIGSNALHLRSRIDRVAPHAGERNEEQLFPATNYSIKYIYDILRMFSPGIVHVGQKKFMTSVEGFGILGLPCAVGLDQACVSNIFTRRSDKFEFSNSMIIVSFNPTDCPGKGLGFRFKGGRVGIAYIDMDCPASTIVHRVP
jgi:hypothetical protein